MPDQVGLELIARQLEETIPGSVAQTTFFRNRATLEIAPEHVRGVLATLRELTFRRVADVSTPSAKCCRVPFEDPD